MYVAEIFFLVISLKLLEHLTLMVVVIIIEITMLMSLIIEIITIIIIIVVACQVCQQVERWVKETSSSSKHVSAVAVFKAKPDDDALFNGSIASGASSSSSLSNSGGETRWVGGVG